MLKQISSNIPNYCGRYRMVVGFTTTCAYYH